MLGGPGGARRRGPRASVGLLSYLPGRFRSIGWFSRVPALLQTLRGEGSRLKAGRAKQARTLVSSEIRVPNETVSRVSTPALTTAVAGCASKRSDIGARAGARAPIAPRWPIRPLAGAQGRAAP